MSVALDISLAAALLAPPPATIDARMDFEIPLTIAFAKGPRLDALINCLPRVEAVQANQVTYEREALPAAVAEMKERLDAGEQLTGEQWQRLLMRTGVISTKPQWRADQVITVTIRNCDWLPEARIRMAPRDSHLGVIEHFPVASWRGGCDLDVNYGFFGPLDNERLGQLSVGKHHVVFDVSIERGNSSGYPVWRGPGDHTWKTEFYLDFEVTAGDPPPPPADPARTQAIRESIGLAVDTTGQHQSPRAILIFDPQVPGAPRLPSAVDLTRVLLLRDGVTQSQFFVSLRSGSSNGGGFAYWAVDQVPASVLRDAAELSRWTLRIEGTPQERDGVLTGWNGSFDLPLAEAIKAERSRMADKPPRVYSSVP